MSILVVRHGLSEANNRENYGTPAFGNPDAGLMPKGEDQARNLGDLLVRDFGVDLTTEPVAVSELRRTQETAQYAGFQNLVIYKALNEEKGGLTDKEVLDYLVNRRSPDATIRAVRALIDNPPVERIWFTHAFVIATLCNELGVYGNARFTPRFCEVRELPI
jgi:phosphohistidine phosphatase SixA